MTTVAAERTLTDRAEWLTSMIIEFLDTPMEDDRRDVSAGGEG